MLQVRSNDKTLQIVSFNFQKNLEKFKELALFFPFRIRERKCCEHYMLENNTCKRKRSAIIFIIKNLY